MPRRTTLRALGAAALATAIALSLAAGPARAQGAAADSAPAPRRGAPPLLTQALPPMQGDRLRVTMLEVVYAPGQTGTPHVHPCAVFGYVAAGAVRMQFRGFPERVYRAGETFYEAANGGHLVGANASAAEPARLVVTFVCDRDGPLTLPLDAARP